MQTTGDLALYRGRRTLIWALTLALLLLTALVVAEYQRRQNLYWYDVDRDYAYAFHNDHVAYATVKVSRDGFELPPEIDSGTSMLELNLAATLAGRWFEPCLDLSLGELTERQCFERSMSGQRYVILPQSAALSRQVIMRGSNLRWDEQDAVLLRFETPQLEAARLLVLAPHPDDGEIAAFGLYSTHDAFVATVTAGNHVDGLYGRLGLDEETQDTLRGEVRVWDSLAVPQLGGVGPERTVSLGYSTYSLKEMHRSARSSALDGAIPVKQFRQGAVAGLLAGREATETWASVIADLVALITAVQPDVIVSPHPALDGHTDHQYTTIALLEALTALQDSAVTLLLYTNHHPLSEHYPFGGSATLVTLPPWFGGAPFAGILSHRVGPDTQLRKLFALDAMHDLREPPLPVVSGAPADALIQRLRQAADFVGRDPVGDYSFFRRAVRPNELFFVYPPGARPSVDAFLVTLGP